MSVHKTTKAIGDALVFSADEDDTVTVTTPEVDDLELTVIEIPDDVPVEKYHESEIICTPDTDDGIVALYAQVTELCEMSVDYDVYAVRLPDDGETEGLGEIQTLTTTE